MISLLTLSRRFFARVHRRSIAFGLATLIAGVSDVSNAQSVGVAALERMHHAYDGKWYSTLTFTQQTIIARANGKADTTTWYEALSGPAQLRIDFGLPALGNGAIFTADSTYGVRGGQLRRTDPVGNPFLPLIMGVYLQPVTETVRQLRQFGFDVSRATTGTWEGKAITIVGAATNDDSTSAQFWIENERQLVVRVRGMVRGTGGADIRLGGYERVGAAWLATRVSMVSGGQTQTETYSSWNAGIPLADALFDPAQWSTAPHWFQPTSRSTTATALTVSGNYATAVAIVSDACGGSLVQPNPTVVTHDAGASALQFTHAGSVYSGTIQTSGHFSTTPLSSIIGGSSYVVALTGAFTVTGFTATVTVDRTDTTHPKGCRYVVAWTAIRRSGTNVIPG